MWFFKKRKSDKDIENIQISLKNSFSNIKKDIDHIHKSFGDKHKSYDKKHEEHEKQLQKINNKLLLLEEQISSISLPIKGTSKIKNKKNIQEEMISIEPYINEALTDVQLELLQKLATISSISEKGWVTTQALGKEMYPTKEYSAIRSLLSDYTAILSEFGLMEKQRKGRKTILRITEKGKEFIPKEFYETINLKEKINQ